MKGRTAHFELTCSLANSLTRLVDAAANGWQFSWRRANNAPAPVSVEGETVSESKCLRRRSCVPFSKGVVSLLSDFVDEIALTHCSQLLIDQFCVWMLM